MVIALCEMKKQQPKLRIKKDTVRRKVIFQMILD